MREALGPALGTRYPYSTIYLAVLVAARFFGAGPAIAAALLGLLAGDYLFVPEGPTLLPTYYSFGVLFYAVTCGAAIWLIGMQGLGRQRAEETARLADEQLQKLLGEVAERERDQRLSAQLRAIVESSEDAIISKDLDGIIRSWNYGAERIFGYAASETVGQSISLLVPPDRAREEADILERIRRGSSVRQFETLRSCKDGRQIFVSLTVSPIRNAAGVISGASYIARDITQRKAFEEQLRQTQKLESLGVLAGGLAHDFNNLLTGIMGNASLAAQELGEPDQVRRRIEEILQASERAALLVRQMLAYAGKGRFVVERLDLSAQVTQIVPLVRTSIPRVVELSLDLAHDLPAIEADPSQIQQLVMNLAINAAEAVGDTPGTVTITTSSRQSDAERQVVLEVKDTGCGMDETTRSRIFDPFFTTKFTGRGLGLAAVMGIIRAHRGTISVDSAPGAGSTFIVVLPAAAEAPTMADGASPPEQPAELRGYGNVLVVDDEALVRNMARFTLERCGYSVETASDGRAAVEAFTSHPYDFDAILLDLTMPVMGGEEALDRIQGIRPEVPVVLSSGYSEAEALTRFRDRGLAGFLQKPYTATALARKVKHAVRARAPG